MNVIAWERPDGGVSIMYPAYGDLGRSPGLTDTLILNGCLKKAQAAMDTKFGGKCIPHVIESSTLPSDELFDAYTWDDGVKVDVDKASLLELSTDSNIL